MNKETKRLIPLILILIIYIIMAIIEKYSTIYQMIKNILYKFNIQIKQFVTKNKTNKELICN